MKRYGLLISVAMLSACTHMQHDTTETKTAAQDRFMQTLAMYCGQAFSGKIVSNRPASNQPDAFEDKLLVMHVRGCDDPSKELRIPFHVGDDRSRTWILTRTDNGIRLKHDHRHADGSDDTLTMYGGDTLKNGTAKRQEFPVDQESIDLFKREGSEASIRNQWAFELERGEYMIYELSRPDGRLFQVKFDLTRPVKVPPAPWGY